MGGDGIAEMAAADNEPLVGRAADDASEPFAVDNAEKSGGDQEGSEMKRL